MPYVDPESGRIRFGPRPAPRSLWAPANPGPQTARQIRNQEKIDRHREHVAAVEEKRAKEEEKARRESSGKYKHPAHAHGGGHIDPSKMTARELKAHGLVVTRGLFGGVTGVQSRESVIMNHHEAAQDIHSEKRLQRDLRRQMTAKGADRKAIAKAIAASKGRQAKASSRARGTNRLLRW